MIGVVTYDDCWKLPEYLIEFQQESPYYRQFTADPQWTRNRLIALHQSGMMLGAKNTAEDGTITGVMLGMVTTPWFTTDTLAMEMILFVDRDARGASIARKLILEFERQAIHEDADYIITGSSAGINDEGVGILYQRMGYHKTPTGYMKGLRDV